MSSPSLGRKGPSREEESENRVGASRSSVLDSDPESMSKRGKGLTYSKSVVDKERKIGHRRVDDTGQVSYKKVSTNQLMGSIQLGIQNSIGAMSKYDERDLLMQDFMTVETVVFSRNGSQTTPAHPYSDFTFRTVAPLAFRYFLNLFGIRREDFMLSICNYEMRELSNPGASGSIFYLTNDDEFILKTVQHKEAEFLQKLLPGYYMNLNQNPHTLLPKFFGMFTYQCNQKNIRLTVMNNLLPSNVKMHLKFDLKGSTYKRKASKHERAKKSPTFKDLDFVEILPDGLLLEPETYNALISTLRRDCRVLESFRIMDYSLLIGVHNLDQAAREDSDHDASSSPAPSKAKKETHRLSTSTAPKKLASTCMESIQAQTEPIDEQEHVPPGGIPARNHKGERLLLYLGIIDILQSYRMRKKLEHTFKAIIHDGDTVSVHRPGFYAHRFLDFMADKVFKKIPSPLKHSPSKKSKRDSVKKASTSSAAHVANKLQDATNAAASSAPAGASNTASTSEEATDATSHKTNGLGRGDGEISAIPAAGLGGGAMAVVAAEAMALASSSAAAAEAAETASSAVDDSYFQSSNLEAMINLPAVLWDRPAGSKTRVPLPAAATSATPAAGATGAAARSVVSPIGAQNSSSSSASSAKTVVHRGAAVGYSSSYNKPDVIAGHMVSSSNPNTSSLGRAKNRVHEQIKGRSESGDRGSDSRMSGEDQGTPSHLSVGAGSMGGGWNTPTWTEGTPSFTESTCSADVPVAGNTPSRNLRASRESIVTRNYKDTPYHETEI